MTDPQTTITAAAAPAGALTPQRLEPDPPTRADRVRAIEAQYRGTIVRSTLAGRVTLALERANGDRIAGRGADTEAALVDLEVRLASWIAED